LRKEVFELRRANETLKSASVFLPRSSTRPNEVTAFIDEHRGRFGVEPICKVLDVSASTYYHRAAGQRSQRATCDEPLLDRVCEVHAANYSAYGYRKKMWLALKRAGETVGRDHVKRPDARPWHRGAKRRGKPWRTTIAAPAATRSPDVVNRDFTADRPDALWVANFTYVRCYEGMVFFSFVIDVYSRRIVGWQFAGHMRTDLVLDSLRMALTRRQHGADVDLIHHSDAGSQYTSFAFQQLLDDHHVIPPAEFETLSSSSTVNLSPSKPRVGTN
jgi:transposase InsO family protein